MKWNKQLTKSYLFDLFVKHRFLRQIKTTTHEYRINSQFDYKKIAWV